MISDLNVTAVCSHFENCVYHGRLKIETSHKQQMHGEVQSPTLY